MKLPNGDQALVDDRKLWAYILSPQHPHGRDHALLFKTLLAIEGLKAGQSGTVVFVHNQGKASEVEFILSPRKSVVATVHGDQLLKLRGLPSVSAATS